MVVVMALHEHEQPVKALKAPLKTPTWKHLVSLSTAICIKSTLTYISGKVHVPTFILFYCILNIAGAGGGGVFILFFLK